MTINIEVALTKRRRDMQEDIFHKPPQNYEEFLKRLGIWNGLGDALNIVQDTRKDDDE